MAITKIWNIPKSKKGDLSSSLHRSLEYIVNPDKTDGGLLVGGVNCLPDAEAAYRQMCGTKKLFGKELGRQGYHIVLSCPVGEGDPQTMYRMTEEFTKEFIGDRYETLFAVHADKGHLHSHIIFNSCSIIDGYKYQYVKGDWKKIIQPIVNRLCEKYGLSIMPAEYSDDPQKMSRREYEYQKSMKEVVIADAEYCMANAENLEEFFWNMEQMGYEVKRGKHIAVRMDGMKRFRRLDTWDERFSMEQIEETLAAIRGKDVTVKVQTTDPHRYEGRCKSEYQRKFFVKMVRLRQLETCRFSGKAAQRYRDLKRMHELQEQYLYLTDHNIKSAEELLDRRGAITEALEEMGRIQKSIYRNNRRQKNIMKKSPGMSEFCESVCEENAELLAAIKAEKKKLYRERKLVDDIMTESMYRSVIRLQFEEKTESDIKRPKIPESPWKKEKRERLEAERQRRRQEQERIRLEQMDKTRSYHSWHTDGNGKFLDAVNLPEGTPWVTEYLAMLQPLLLTKQDERDKEFFDTPVIDFKEFAKQMEQRERGKAVESVAEYEPMMEPETTSEPVTAWVDEPNPESVTDTESTPETVLEPTEEQDIMVNIMYTIGITSDNLFTTPDHILSLFLYEEGAELSEFAIRFVSAAQKLGVDGPSTQIYEKALSVYQARTASEEVTEQIRGEEPQEPAQLPDDFTNFLQLPTREQAKCLCHTKTDVDNVFNLLSDYAKSVGYQFSSFDEAFDLSYDIKKAAQKIFLEQEAAPIVRELRNASLDKTNFHQVKAESMAPAFAAYGNDLGRLSEVFDEVARQMDVKLDYDESYMMVKDISNCMEQKVRSKQRTHMR